MGEKPRSGCTRLRSNPLIPLKRSCAKKISNAIFRVAVIWKSHANGSIWTTFDAARLLVAVPVGSLKGLQQKNRFAAHAADASVTTEANPHIYKLVPGKEREVFSPLWILTAESLAKELERQETMTMAH